MRFLCSYSCLSHSRCTTYSMWTTFYYRRNATKRMPVRSNMKIVRIQILCSMLSLCTMAFAQPLQVSISTPSSTVKSGAPVVILVKLMNGTDHTVRVAKYFGEVLPGSYYKVTSADGRAVETTPLAKGLERGYAGSRTVNDLVSGGSMVEELKITSFVDMTSPGMYRVVLI